MGVRKLQAYFPNANHIKIWSGLITRKLTKIAHILTRENQFGYKEGISTIDDIIKFEQYIENANRDAKILRMGLSKAFGAINRTPLWSTLYTKGIPIDMIKHKTWTPRNKSAT